MSCHFDAIFTFHKSKNYITINGIACTRLDGSISTLHYPECSRDAYHINMLYVYSYVIYEPPATCRGMLLTGVDADGDSFV